VAVAVPQTAHLLPVLRKGEDEDLALYLAAVLQESPFPLQCQERCWWSELCLPPAVLVREQAGLEVGTGLVADRLPDREFSSVAALLRP
jgi:hypothetical protein